MSLSENAQGLPIETGDNVPLAAGMATDGRTTMVDKAIPKKLKDCTHTDPKTGAKSSKAFNLRESYDEHERVEFALMQAGMTYDDAHRWATEVEHARIRSLGFDPNEIEEKGKKYIDAAAHRARMEGALASGGLDNEPYVDDEQTELLNGEDEDEEYEHCIYDRDGNEYINPRQLRLLDTFDAFAACNEDDGTYAVIEPTTGMLLSHGHDISEQAVDAARLMAARHGTMFLKRRIDAEPPMSQQQLRQKFSADEEPQTLQEESEQQNSEQQQPNENL